MKCGKKGNEVEEEDEGRGEKGVEGSGGDERGGK